MSHKFSFRMTVGRHFIEGYGPYSSPRQTLTILDESISPLKLHIAALEVCHHLKVRFRGFTKANPAQFYIQCTKKTSTEIWEGGREILS